MVSINFDKSSRYQKIHKSSSIVELRQNFKLHEMRKITCYIGK